MVIQEIRTIIVSYTHNKRDVHNEYINIKKEYKDLGMYSMLHVSSELQQFINIVLKLHGGFGDLDSNMSSKGTVRLAISEYLRLININYIANRYQPDKVLCKLLKCYKPFTFGEAFSYIGHHFNPPHVWKTISRLWN